MKAISLWQPWASLWLTDCKVHETRHWPTNFRGWLAVHAAKRFERDFPPDDPMHDILDSEFGGHWGMELPTGALLGVVNLVACKSTNVFQPTGDDLVCGDYSPDRFAWERGGFRLLPRPIPYRGAQGFFNIADDLMQDTHG